MSLYNMMFGSNPYKLVFLAMIGVLEEQIPRFRDCYAKIIEGKPFIIILTRTGGRNREKYKLENQFLCDLPGFIETKNQIIDNSYAEFYYSVHKDHLNTFNQLLKIGGKDVGESKWNDLFSSLEDGSYKNNKELTKSIEATVNLIKGAFKS